ncbi:hypothetical protein [Nostoc sp. FACHB-190]|uniref:hypothetical protein n=1 Tax=Nostoc sp. FACHB-190 TaxID=2692838 RepID=UPI001689A400|nr:hypothetical protein [Nostoc sp. FACHB-190]
MKDKYVGENKFNCVIPIMSETAFLTHEEHQAIPIPQSNWIVKIQREYEPEGWRYVAD